MGNLESLSAWEENNAGRKRQALWVMDKNGLHVYDVDRVFTALTEVKSYALGEVLTGVNTTINTIPQSAGT